MSTNNFPRISAILARIPDAATRWPGWHWSYCPSCGEECDTDSSGNPLCGRRECDEMLKEIVPAYRFDPITDGDSPDRWHGGDTDPRNMHHLLDIADSLSGSVAETNRRMDLAEGSCRVLALLDYLEEATR